MSSDVYIIKASREDGQKVLSEKARTLFKAGGFADCFKENDLTAVKVHVGEDGNNTYITAPCIKGLVDELLELRTKPFVTDTTTLYVGRRHNAIDHAVLAAEHGFSLEELGIPFIAPDGLSGTSAEAIPVNGEINKEVFIAHGIARCRSILSVAHFTGHVASGLGATLKTLGMGCASKHGKMQQHAALTLNIGDDCTSCGVCSDYCPADAITLDDVKAHIDQDKCIGCAECMAMCRFGAVGCNWGLETEVMQKSIAEHAQGVLKGKENRAAFFNFVMSVTKECDCFGTPDMPSIVEDIGIVASADPVAVDAAALDLVEDKAGCELGQLLGNNEIDPRCQIVHAERIGVGSRDYQLVEIDQQVKQI
ncbi:MAG: 4Fe-4S ferredoxin [Planctomycetes bacterium B3_Pla]|nr:MAG: 4Fe-4S ferredoxin [Planctomycetes bacterium B3_Pla]